ncbi:MAG: glycosyl transferase family 2, partial [Acidobacteria bacterium]|nr:glycosyl transferase family 2 [Acidobacteriota bacterium]
MSDHAVFFDPSRRRWWWIKRIATVVGLFAVVVASIFMISVIATPFLPEMPGITSAIQRTLKRSVRLPRHQTQLQQFLLKKSREKLLTAIASDQMARKARAAQPPVKAPGIVAAFYAPWQETGLHSLRANANHMTHLLPAWVHLQEDARGLDFHDWDPLLTPHNKDVLDIAHEHNLNVTPVLSNAQLSDFDPKRVH